MPNINPSIMLMQQMARMGESVANRTQRFNEMYELARERAREREFRAGESKLSRGFTGEQNAMSRGLAERRLGVSEAAGEREAKEFDQRQRTRETLMSGYGEGTYDPIAGQPVLNNLMKRIQERGSAGDLTGARELESTLYGLEADKAAQARSEKAYGRYMELTQAGVSESEALGRSLAGLKQKERTQLRMEVGATDSDPEQKLVAALVGSMVRDERTTKQQMNPFMPEEFRAKEKSPEDIRDDIAKYTKIAEYAADQVYGGGSDPGRSGATAPSGSTSLRQEFGSEVVTQPTGESSSVQNPAELAEVLKELRRRSSTVDPRLVPPTGMEEDVRTGRRIPVERAKDGMVLWTPSEDLEVLLGSGKYRRVKPVSARKEGE